MATFEWKLASLIGPEEGGDEARFALVMLNQPIRNLALIRELWQRCQLPSPSPHLFPLHLQHRTHARVCR